ncbi:condensation domain-containing protein, partial [Streptomyces sp. NPDC001348]
MTDSERQYAEMPASAAQRGLWLIEQLGEPSAAYTMHPAVRAEGDFDTATARRAFEELVRRHEALRTGFAWRDGELIQLIEEPGADGSVRVDFEVIEVGREEAVTRAGESAAAPFDLLTGPLMR